MVCVVWESVIYSRSINRNLTLMAKGNNSERKEKKKPKKNKKK
jgi:hypothetical protein